MSGFALPIGVNLAMSFLWEGNLESPIERDLSRKSKSTLNVPNQRYECLLAFPVWHAAKSTLNARVGIHPNQRSMRVWHAAGLKTPPTRGYILKFTPVKCQKRI